MATDEVSEKIIAMAQSRAPDKTICPSEVARELYLANWRKHMETVRNSAIDLHKAGVVTITQKGEAVNPDTIKGPIRIKYNQVIHK